MSMYRTATFPSRSRLIARQLASNRLTTVRATTPPCAGAFISRSRDNQSLGYSATSAQHRIRKHTVISFNFAHTQRRSRLYSLRNHNDRWKRVKPDDEFASRASWLAGPAGLNCTWTKEEKSISNFARLRSDDFPVNNCVGVGRRSSEKYRLLTHCHVRCLFSLFLLFSTRHGSLMTLSFLLEITLRLGRFFFFYLLSRLHVDRYTYDSKNWLTNHAVCSFTSHLINVLIRFWIRGEKKRNAWLTRLIWRVDCVVRSAIKGFDRFRCLLSRSLSPADRDANHNACI